MNDGQTLHNSPYVEQIERFAGSVKQLSQIFLGLEEKKQAFSDEEIEMMFRRLKEKVCSKCEKCEWCWGENFIHTYQMGYEVLSAVDHYGNDLNTETKRKLMQRCIMAPRFLREMLEGFHDARQNMIGSTGLQEAERDVRSNWILLRICFRAVQGNWRKVFLRMNGWSGGSPGS